MKKLKLDLLEEMPAWEVDLPEIDLPEIDQIDLDQVVPDENEAALPPGDQRWAFKKLLIIVAPIGLMVMIIITGIIYYYSTKPVSTPPPPAPIATVLPPLTPEEQSQEASKVAAALPDAVRMVYIKDFIIDLTDDKGKHYVLMCDVALQISGSQTPTDLQNDANIREIIYKTAQRNSVAALRSVEERKKIKKELAVELEKTLGEKSVKNVYFINYFIM